MKTIPPHALHWTRGTILGLFEPQSWARPKPITLISASSPAFWIQIPEVLNLPPPGSGSWWISGNLGELRAPSQQYMYLLQSLHAGGVPQYIYKLKSELPHTKWPIKPADDSSALLALPTLKQVLATPCPKLSNESASHQRDKRCPYHFVSCSSGKCYEQGKEKRKLCPWFLSYVIAPLTDEAKL